MYNILYFFLKAADCDRLEALLTNALGGCSCSPCLEDVNIFENAELVFISTCLNVPFYHGFYLPPAGEFGEERNVPENINAYRPYC
jgi:hypothetical protein